MTEQDKLVDRLAKLSHRVDKGNKTEVTILGKKYRTSDTKRWVLDKIIDILFELEYPNESKSKKTQLSFVQTADVKIASYLMLNLWSVIPFVHAIHWRYIYRTKTSEFYSGLIDSVLNNPEQLFFLKSSLTVRNLLVSRLQMIRQAK